MLTLILALALNAPPSTRLAYEARCLYCHSAELTESKRLTEAGWRALIEKMRLKAPLLISRSDVPRLARFMTGTLKLVPARREPHEARPTLPPTLPPVKEPEVVPPPIEPVAPVELDEPSVRDDVTPVTPSEEQVALDQEGARLIERRCSKCHTLGRVYGKLDTLERSLTTLERMRLKTGSGITDHELDVLRRYLRSQFN